MAHFAKVLNGTVTNIIVAEQEFMDTFIDDSPGEWIQTSYNTKEGVHLNGGTPLRKNYAIIGGTYDSTRDAFIPPKPYPSWTLNEDKCIWVSPKTYPTDGKYYDWDEENQEWKEEE
jgi:hypothetical protein